MAIQSLERAQLLELLACAKAHRRRDWLMILLAFNHGLRATEIVGGWLTSKDRKTKEIKRVWYPGLTPGNFSRTHLTVHRLKGSLRTVQELATHENPLLDERAAALDFLRNQPGNQRLFPITRERFWQIVQQHAKAAGIPKHLRHPHVLKHSIAMQTIEIIGIHKVKQHLGHKSLQSTGEYLKVTDKQAGDAVRAALAGGSAL